MNGWLLELLLPQTGFQFFSLSGLLHDFLTPIRTSIGLGIPPIVLNLVDLLLVLALTYMVLRVIAERRTLWMVQGFILLMLAAAGSGYLGLRLLNFVLTNLVIGSAVAMALILQAEVRRFLEQLGRGKILQLLKPVTTQVEPSTNVVDEIVSAVKDLSHTQTGALLLIETSKIPLDERDFSVPGVRLNADISKELILTIFQPSTLLHDGAMLIRGKRIIAAGLILPLSERAASQQLGTRHRAAMGITERVENCVCIVVSEETGSISLAEQGALIRPLTSSKLKELLEERLTGLADKEVETSGLQGFSQQLQTQGVTAVSRLRRFPAFRKRT